MNKRIQQLAEQATRNVESANSYHSTVFDQEKFALLIIEECANLFSKTFTNEQYPRRIDKDIKKHFGIIE
jgi:hypothetical protein